MLMLVTIAHHKFFLSKLYQVFHNSILVVKILGLLMKLTNLPVCYDDEDDEERSNSLEDNIISRLPSCSAITPDEPVLSTEEPDNSLSMRDEHLDTIPATESDEVIKSGVENLIPIPSESEGILEHMCDVPFHANSSPLDVSKDQFEDFFESNDEFSSTDDDSFFIDKIDHVKASPPDFELVSSEVMEIAISEVGRIDDDILLTIKDDILRENLESDFFLEEVDAFLAVEDEPTSSQFPQSYLDPEGDILLLEAFLNDDHSSDFKTKSSFTSLNSLLEETNNVDNSLPEFTTFLNVLFDAEYESDSSDDQSCSDEDVSEKIFSKPLFEEEIIPMKIDPHPNNAESDLMESLRTHDSSLLIPSKIDSLLDEDILILKDLPSLSFLAKESFHLIFLRFLVLLQNHQMEKSPDLLSHQSLKAFQPSGKCPMTIHGQNNPILDVKENQEKDKIGSKPDKNRKRGEAWKSQKQIQSIKQEKLKKIQVEGPHLQNPTSFIDRRKEKGLKLQFTESTTTGARTANSVKLFDPGTSHDISIPSDVSSSHSSSRHLHSTSYTNDWSPAAATWQLPIGQPPVTWQPRQVRSTPATVGQRRWPPTVNAAGHRSTAADHGGDRRSTVVVNDGQRRRPPVNGGGQRRSFKTLCLLKYALMKRHDYDITVFFTKRVVTIMVSEPAFGGRSERFADIASPDSSRDSRGMVNTRIDAELVAAVQNALQTLLPQIRAEIREEFRTGSGPSDSGGNPPLTDTETSTKFMQRFLRLAGFLEAAASNAEEQAKNFQWGLRRSTLNHLMCISFMDVTQVANAARNYEILHERDDDDVELPDKRQKSGDRHQPTTQQSSHRNHGHNNDHHRSDRRGGSNNHRSNNNNSGNNNRSFGNGRDQRNRGQHPRVPLRATPTRSALRVDANTHESVVELLVPTSSVVKLATCRRIARRTPLRVHL
nr:zinc finger, CCHC-type, retrotransposon Gag domain protein [Tanacetum cinerariifolium]